MTKDIEILMLCYRILSQVTPWLNLLVSHKGSWNINIACSTYTSKRRKTSKPVIAGVPGQYIDLGVISGVMIVRTDASLSDFQSEGRSIDNGLATLPHCVLSRKDDYQRILRFQYETILL